MFTTYWNLHLSSGIKSQAFNLMDWENQVEAGEGGQMDTGITLSLTLGLIRRNPVRDAFLLHERKPPE